MSIEHADWPRPGGHTLVVRLDNAGDVLLAGPAVRAAAAGSDRVTLLCGPQGAAAGRLLPGVDEVRSWDAPWVGFTPPPVDAGAIGALVGDLRDRAIDRAALLSSFHQSPLPTALLLRLAGVGELAAISDDYPGSLLDHRLARRPDHHEVQSDLAVVAALGLRLPPGDDGRLAVRLPATTPTPEHWPQAPVVVVHPGASVPARALPAERIEPIIDALLEEGWAVVVTGGPGEPRPCPRPGVTDLVGRTDLAALAAVLGAADVLVAGNSGPAHLAAAMGTPVVSIFAPVVAWAQWRPWGVPTIPLGMQGIACAGCRARTCPLEGQPCLDEVTPAAICAAVRGLAGRPSLFGGASSSGVAEQRWRRGVAR